MRIFGFVLNLSCEVFKKNTIWLSGIEIIALLKQLCMIQVLII